ncbi:MAG: FecR domain-containing protein [Chitinophaga sp.]|uniref:FecR family protein n=1 Tax=Chitinophaga sp. TaxID=1869181 RepID=UPI001B0A511F|nr:FecR family protein [Chitinophaga sp.]MBO9732663.1 FecR domain-containing protein [Chitinophaga sp.]
MQRFHQIIKAYLEGRISKRALSKQLSAGDNDLRTTIKDQLESGTSDGLTSPESRQVMYNRVMVRVKEKEKGRTIFFNRWFRAAAILLPLTIVAGWMYHAREKHPEKIAQYHLPSPVKNKVMLTLSDGTAIALDSSGKGVVAQQGNTVLKKENGQLVYHPSADKGGEVLYNKIVTPKGTTFHVTLPDGSVAWLNAVSSIRFPVAFSKDSRQVEITGEAYFEIQKNQTPFRVKAAGGEIQVLGTKFNVNGYTDESVLKVTLLEGAVKVAGRKDSVMLRPGQQAVLLDGNTKVTQADVDEVMAWKNGNFVFNSLTLSEIMRQISRWYDIDVTYEGPVSQKRFTGIVGRNESIEEVLSFMQAAGIRYKMNDRKIVIAQ